MSNPLVHAFFVGRALSEAVYSQVEGALTDTLSELGKLDAELRERLRLFTEEVIERANRAEEEAMRDRSGNTVTLSSQSVDLQATIDELRAEIAQLRTELKRYRSSSAL
jgi:demethoxyubiquinone hydroxylase (CLK1/Coq7/Cat5 family)